MTEDTETAAKLVKRAIALQRCVIAGSAVMLGALLVLGYSAGGLVGLAVAGALEGYAIARAALETLEEDEEARAVAKDEQA